MSNTPNESVDDVLSAMMRVPEPTLCTAAEVHEFANRMKAAYRLEREQTEAIHLDEICAVRKECEDKFKQGNTAKMRKALAEILKSCRFWIKKGTIHQKTFKKYTDIITDALDAPARNCDKFASNEVIAARMAFDKYCLGRHCGECPHLQYVNIHNCWIAWFLAKAEGEAK